MDERMLKVSEIAKRLHVHATTVQRWIREEGYFPNARKVGLARNSPYIVPEGDVIALEERLQARTSSEN